MKVRLLIVPLLQLLLVAEAYAQDAIAREIKKLQGTWIVQSAQVDGASDPSCKGLKFTFVGNKVTLERMGNKSDLVVFKLDPTRNPKQIDFEEKVPPTMGIYELKGDRMWLCYAIERPDGFKPADGVRLLVLQRQK